MRRIYESGALHRDDEDPFSPNEDQESAEPQAFRSVPGNALTRALIPTRLRHRAISVDVSTPRTEVTEGRSVPFEVTMRNSFPVPITIPTVSPVLWTWSVDGHLEASRIRVRDPPEEPCGFAFDRGERKRFVRRWDGLFRVSESEWEPAGPGEYTIGAGLNVEDPASSGLADETTVRIVPDS